MYLNKDNFNNKPKRAQVIHHQWLYGRSAIFSLDRVLKLVANSADGLGDSLYGREKDGHSSEHGTQSIAAAMSVDPDEGYYHAVHIWEADAWNGMVKGDYTSPAKLDPNMFDNNDGCTVIQFESGQEKPKVCFVTPDDVDGEHYKSGNGPWTPKQYLAFYYNAKDRKEWDKDLNDDVNKAIKSVASNSRPMTKAEVSKLLPKFKIGG